MKQWNGSLEQARKLAYSVWDRVYSVGGGTKENDPVGWFRVMSSVNTMLGWIDPTGTAHIYGNTGYKVAARYSELED